MWDFLREGGLAYCGLYDEGYTSIGAVHNTAKNAKLLVPAGAAAGEGGAACGSPAHAGGWFGAGPRAVLEGAPIPWPPQPTVSVHINVRLCVS